LFVFFGVLVLVFSGLAGYASWLVWRKEHVEHQITDYSLTTLLICTGLSLIAAILLIGIGIRTASRTPPYDTHDPNQPNLKF